MRIMYQKSIVTVVECEPRSGIGEIKSKIEVSSSADIIYGRLEADVIWRRCLFEFVDRDEALKLEPVWLALFEVKARSLPRSTNYPILVGTNLLY